MKRLLLMLTLVLACGGVFAQEWEYASLIVDGNGAAWVEPGASYDSSQVALLLREMTGSNAGVTDDHVLNVMNHVGADGWELVTNTAAGTTLRFTFKRSTTD